MSDSEISGSESELSDDENNDAFMLFRDEQEVGRQRILAMLQDDEDEINFDGFLPNFDKDPAFHFCNKQSEDISSSVYSGRPGPMRIFDGSCSALEYFQLFFTDELFEKISYWTHENACYKIANDPTNNKAEWIQPSLVEIKSYFGIRLAMLMCVDCPRTERYFCEKPDKWIFHTPGFGKVITYRRYIQLSRYLHFCDETTADKNDRLYKVRPFLSYIQNKFEEEYYPSKNISIDECMIPFKGRLGIKQYIKSKPTKWGIKAFLLCDSATAYCYRFEIYIAKNSVFEGENLGLTTAVVLNLTKGIENMGHILYTDNFYTSPVLAYNLKNRGIGIVGTVRKNRKCYPKQLADVKDRDLHKGECKWMMSDGMLALVWKDNRLVHLLSTVHQPDINVVLRRNKQGVLEEVRCPQMVKDYNSHMGGVDRNDQMCHYSKSARQYRWYMRLVLKGLLWCVFNAYVIEGHVIDHKPGRGRARDFQQFIDELVHSLVGENRAVRKKRKRPSVDEEIPDRLLDVGCHFPTTEDGDSTNHTCVVCTKKHHVFSNAHGGVSRKDNPFKLTKTIFKCSGCGTYLCIKKGATCFRDFHTKVEYWR